MLRGQQSQGQGEINPSKEGTLVWAIAPCQESPGSLAEVGKLQQHGAQDTGRRSVGQSLALMPVQTKLFCLRRMAGIKGIGFAATGGEGKEQALTDSLDKFFNTLWLEMFLLLLAPGRKLSGKL